MSNIFADNSLSIGSTPLIRFNRITDGASATVLAKIKGRKPVYSVQCGIGADFVPDVLDLSLVDANAQTTSESVGKTIVVVLPDSGERYLSSVLFEGLFDATGNAIAPTVAA